MIKDFKDYSLLRHNTFGIAAKCRRFVEFGTVEELREVLSRLTADDRPLLLLGGGSNLLLTGDYDGTVLHSAIRGVTPKRVPGGVSVRVGSGEVWDDFVARCVANGWHGAENLSLIPGEVGASAVQNIGAYGVEVKDLIERVEAVEIATGKTVSFTNGACEYAYRQSKFKQAWRDQYVITHVTYALSDTFVPRLDYGNIRTELERRGVKKPDARELRDVIIEMRRSKLPDPAIEGNAGSFFVNPVVSRGQYQSLAARYEGMPHYYIDEDHEKIPAGWMIEQCGWKGRSLGNAGVHGRQALVLVNRGGATGQEILALCRRIQEDVSRRFGVEIYPEVNIR